MITRLLIFKLFFLFSLFPSVSIALPTVKVTIKVIDEQGIPIEDANVGVSFSSPLPVGEGWGADEFSEQKKTDNDGIAIVSAGALGYIDYSAIKDGYYRSADSYKFKDIDGIYGFRRWQPYNPVLTLTLKKIINPIPLYVKQHSGGFSGEFLTIPEMNRPIGFDLIEGDWVAPYGLGIHRDFIFELTGERASNQDFDVTLKLKFSNEYDGIQIYSAPAHERSQLKLPHEAPLDNYNKILIQRYARTPKRYLHHDFPEDRNYFFRVRTKLDDNGNLISAFYGKIYGNIVFGSNGALGFTYYINSNINDRNLEFDINKNLFSREKNKAKAPLLP